MFYFALSFHLHQKVEDAVFGIQIGVDVLFAHIVEQVKIKVIRLTFFELLAEYFFDLCHIGKVVAGEFVGKMIALSVMAG